MLRINKKAISPIIAAVLLVVIVVGLGTAIMGISRNYLTDGEKDMKEKKEEIKCGKDVEIEIVIIADNYQICNATAEDDMASLNVMVSNTGMMDIMDAQVRMVGKKGIFMNNSVLNDSLVMGETVQLNVTYDPEVVGEFRQVKIIPRINLPGIKEHAYCSDVGITALEVPNNCTTFA